MESERKKKRAKHGLEVTRALMATEWARSEFPGYQWLLSRADELWKLAERSADIGYEDMLCDGTIRDIPFVSLAHPARVCNRFTFSVHGLVQTMGRSHLKDLCLAHANNPQVFVWGSEGGGKSHLLNAFAFLKFCEHIRDRKKPRVIWIPNLWHFAGNPLSELVEALLLAYLDSAEKMAALMRASESFETLTHWMKNENLILVADNFDVLESESSGLPARNRQKVLEFVLFFCKERQRVVFCSSGNQSTVDLAAANMQGLTILPVFGADVKKKEGEEDLLLLRDLFYRKYPEIQEPTQKAEALALATSLDAEAAAAAKFAKLARGLVSEAYAAAAKLLSEVGQVAEQAKRSVEEMQAQYDQAPSSGMPSQEQQHKMEMELDRAKTACEQSVAKETAASHETTDRMNHLAKLLSEIVIAANDVKKYAAKGGEALKQASFKTVVEKVKEIAKDCGADISAAMQEMERAITANSTRESLEADIFGPKVVHWGRLIRATGGIPLAIDGFLSGYVSSDLKFDEFFTIWKKKQCDLVKARLFQYFSDFKRRGKSSAETSCAWDFVHFAVSRTSCPMDPALVDCRCFRPAVTTNNGKLDWCEVSPISEVVSEAAHALWEVQEKCRNEGKKVKSEVNLLGRTDM